MQHTAILSIHYPKIVHLDNKSFYLATYSFQATHFSSFGHTAIQHNQLLFQVNSHSQ